MKNFRAAINEINRKGEETRQAILMAGLKGQKTIEIIAGRQPAMPDVDAQLGLETMNRRHKINELHRERAMFPNEWE